jgi:hypothetical protein
MSQQRVNEVGVTLQKIRCVEENDGGGSAEEVFGYLYVKANGKTENLEGSNLWLRVSDGTR